jgi:hypothetical protein
VEGRERLSRGGREEGLWRGVGVGGRGKEGLWRGVGVGGRGKEGLWRGGEIEEGWEGGEGEGAKEKEERGRECGRIEERDEVEEGSRLISGGKSLWNPSFPGI